MRAEHACQKLKAGTRQRLYPARMSLIQPSSLSKAPTGLRDPSVHEPVLLVLDGVGFLCGRRASVRRGGAACTHALAQHGCAQAVAGCAGGLRTLSSAGLWALAPVLAVRWPCFSFLVTICCLPAIGFGLCTRQGHGVRHVRVLPRVLQWDAAGGAAGRCRVGARAASHL